MFNLLMFNVDWSADRVTVPLGRIFEYTDAHISAQFQDGSNNLLLDRLTSLPCLFCEEGTTNETAYVGQINRARITGNDLLLEIREIIGRLRTWISIGSCFGQSAHVANARQCLRLPSMKILSRPLHRQ